VDSFLHLSYAIQITTPEKEKKKGFAAPTGNGATRPPGAFLSLFPSTMYHRPALSLHPRSLLVHRLFHSLLPPLSIVRVSFPRTVMVSLLRWLMPLKESQYDV
jgi:hypothetical protein